MSTDSGKYEQTTARHTTRVSRTATITLKVHPWYGEIVRVVRLHGRSVGTVRVEREDGEVRIFPVFWTDLEPRVGFLAEDDGARLTPQASLDLSNWIAARKKRS